MYRVSKKPHKFVCKYTVSCEIFILIVYNYFFYLEVIIILYATLRSWSVNYYEETKSNCYVRKLERNSEDMLYILCLFAAVRRGHETTYNNEVTKSQNLRLWPNCVTCLTTANRKLWFVMSLKFVLFMQKKTVRFWTGEDYKGDYENYKVNL